MKRSAREIQELLATLKARFDQNMSRHRGLNWGVVEARLLARPQALRSLHAMERTGGEPDVVGRDSKSGEIIFMDCAPESPTARRSVCYDRAGRESRKTHRPDTSAMEMAAAMGVELLSEAEYFALQELGEFDTRTSSWLATPEEIRRRGGALYGERRYGRVFIGHNGAQSYYAVRGFRARLRV